MDMYYLLPDFTGPNMLPEEKMAHYRDNIRPNMQYCGLSFLTKLNIWCEYIKQFDLKMKNSSNLKNASQTTFKSILLTINDAECYDSYYCNVQSLSGIIHSLMVSMAILSILGLVANLFCFVKMHLKYNQSFKRNPFGIYLSSIIFIDCLHIVIAWLLFIVSGIVGSHYKDQLRIYQKFSYVIVPFLLPFWDLTCLIVTWLIIALLIQRSNITRSKLLLEARGGDESSSLSAKKRRKTFCRLALIIGLLFLYTVPKFAEYTFNKDFKTGNGFVVPLLRVIKLYRIIMLKFLAPSVECSIPIIVILAYIGVIKYHEAMLTRRRLLGYTCNLSNSKTFLNSKMKVLSVAGVSKKTQLVIWISVVMLINLSMKLSAVFVSLERHIQGTPKEHWPRLRQIIKYMSIIISIIAVSVKPLIYIHCCPRLLRKDLSVIYSKGLDSNEAN